MSATITILGDNPLYITQNSGHYIDAGVEAYHSDGSIAAAHVAGDVVNASSDVGTEFEIIYSVYENDDNASNLLATATRSVIIVADTSEEDDSSPDNGDTQTTEENIMSKFTFGGDKTGTLTPVMLTRAEKLAELNAIDADERTDGQNALLAQIQATATTDGTLYPAETPQGQAGASFSGMAHKEFFNKLQMKGLQVCGDLVMQDGADIILKKGSGDSEQSFGMRSLIKKVEVVFGDMTTGSFVSADPALGNIPNDADFATNEAANLGDSTYGSQLPKDVDPPALANPSFKWYLRLIQVDGTVSYSEFTAVNDLLGGVGDASSTISILEAMQDINDLQDAVRVIFETEGAARRDDVDALELKIRTDFQALVAHLNLMESQMAAYVHARDEDVHAFVLSRIQELAEDINDAESAIKFHGTAPCSTAASLVFESAAALDASVAGEIGKWSIDVAAVNGDDVRLDDIELAWDAEITTDSKMKVTISQLACDDLDLMPETDTPAFDWVINAVYCGALASDVLDPNRANAVLAAGYMDNLNADADQPDSWYHAERDLVLSEPAEPVTGDRTDLNIDPSTTPNE